MLRRRLYLQIYLTIIASLVTVVLVAGVLWDSYGRDRFDREARAIASTLVSRSLAPVDESTTVQRQAVERLARDLDIEISLFDRDRKVIASTSKHVMRHARIAERRRWRSRHRGPVWVLDLPDGRRLVADFERRGFRAPFLNFILFLIGAALAVGLVSYPFVRRLTRRLEDLQQGVERIGAGDLTARVAVKGTDEVASLAESFNDAAGRIETLLNSHRMLLANASHELRTPLARIRMGVEMLGSGKPERQAALQQDIAELDDLIDEILLMSRLDAGFHADLSQTVDVVALVAEECARYPDCTVSGSAAVMRGDVRLLPRMVRNLVDNAHKHGKPPVDVEISSGEGVVRITVSDGGNGIADADREKVFDPFFRASDRQNIKGYGLGLPLVKQIAEAHGGSVEIQPRGEARSAVRVVLPVGPLL